MKRTLIIALALALALGTTAIAETAESVPTEVEAAADVSAEETEVEAAADVSTEEAGKQVNLEDALKALHNARIEACVESLKAELEGYVDAGKLTQEQADTILKQFSAQKQSQRNGQKHNRCGSQQNGKQKGQRMPGNQMPDANSGATPQMPSNGQQGQQHRMGGQQMPGNQMPDANSGATPQMPSNGQQGQQHRMGGQQMPGNYR